MEKIDYKKTLSFYKAKVGKPEVVTIPALNYLQVDGTGDPNTSPDYKDAIEVLYPVAYTLKFMCKKALGKDYGVMPLEGLWWADDMHDFIAKNKTTWKWTLMIMQPPMITSEMVASAIAEVRTKKAPAAIDKIRFALYDEGRAAQVLYVGPYDQETETIQELHAFIAKNGGSFAANTKQHHEIYLSDPRRTEVSKLKTIIRQPF